ncbi:hypothetical protein EJ08DRAFT_27014 [Tothia fuscella]|uniref:Uncharacterized protein n=1 Tax=Tothia fuscella TaxID=1048955 RepID=A0A9P4NG96_9PEZI|nr:hypothetical protein EJ08DRAFT_27014 [Tothia fuscella]
MSGRPRPGGWLNLPPGAHDRAPYPTAPNPWADVTHDRALPPVPRDMSRQRRGGRTFLEQYAFRESAFFRENPHSGREIYEGNWDGELRKWGNRYPGWNPENYR